MDMKKLQLFMFVFMFMLASISQAQNSHMKFAGIPLDGTIGQFQKKLEAKGYVVNSAVSTILPVGTRAFKGTFMGKKASVAVYYDDRTKIVYGAKAYFDELTEERANQELDNVRDLLSQKYLDGVIREGDEKPNFYMFTENGNVYVYLRKDDTLLSYPYHYSLHLEYSDYENSQKHQGNVMDDL